MNMSRWQAPVRLAVLTAVVVSLWGCFDYKEKITLKPDGSGTVDIDVSIPETAAASFRDIDAAVTPPITSGMLQAKLLIGSAGVRTVESQVPVAPVDGMWNYHVVLEFSDINALNRVEFFSNRRVRTEFVGGKEVRFSQNISPGFVKMAKTYAPTLENYPYRRLFLSAAENVDDFLATKWGNGTLSFEAVMAGVEGTSDKGRVTVNADNTVATQWQFSSADIEKEPAPVLATTVQLPAERGPMPIVIGLMLASLAGILGTAVRLLMLKMKGVN